MHLKSCRNSIVAEVPVRADPDSLPLRGLPTAHWMEVVCNMGQLDEDIHQLAKEEVLDIQAISTADVTPELHRLKGV